MGRRARRLPGRQLPDRLGGVERQVPRHGARASGAASRARCRELASRLVGIERPLSVERSAARTPASTSSPRTTATRCTTSSATSRSTTRRTARTTSDGTQRQPQPQLGRRRADRRHGRSSRCAIASMRNFIATLAFSQGVPMISHGDEIGRTQQRQQQRVRPGQRDHLGELESRRAAARAARRSRAPRSRSGAPIPCCAGATSSAATATEGGEKDAHLAPPDGKEMTDEDWHNPNNRALGMLIHGEATDEQDDRGRPIKGDTLLLLAERRATASVASAARIRAGRESGSWCSTPRTPARRSSSRTR